MAKDKLQKKLLIAQEIKFARALSSNDKKTRLKMLKKLRSWISLRCSSSFTFTETDFMRVWKGLFYCMWMSDKPLIQEELAESISNLVHCIESTELALLYTKCALNTLSSEWFGIDRYRMDKFEMLTRRIIRQTFVMCRKVSWDEECVKSVSKIIEDILLDTKGSMGFKFHITELYMEELAKITESKISEDMVTELLRPFAIYLVTITDDRQIRNVMKHIFRYLIFQSDVGLEYTEKFQAWRQAGFPTGDIDAMQKVEISDEDCENEMNDSDSDDKNDANENIRKLNEKVLDPRAGRVDVELPQIPFDAQQISNLLKSYKFHDTSTTKTRRQIVRLINEFDELAKGNMPLGVKQVDVAGRKKKGISAKKSALKLLNFENKLYNDSHNRIKRKKRNKFMLNMENSNEIDDDGDDDDGDDDDDNGKIEDTPLQKKKKKKHLIEKEIHAINGEQDDEHTFQDKKIIKRKRKKNKNTDEMEEVGDISITKKLKLKKKSLKNVKKEMGVKDKNIKVKKLKNKKKSLKSLIFDGMEDFVNFKQSTEIKTKKKKVKHDLENSGNFLNTECPSTSTIAHIPMSNGSSLPEKKIKKKEYLPAINISPKKLSPKKAVSSKVLQPSRSERLESGVRAVSRKKKVSPTKAVNVIELNTKKRVKIMLNRNTAQHTSEYMQQLRSSPAIPFDANRKPLNGVLKPSPISSPINPFYKKK